MYVNLKKRNERRVHGPNVVLCEVCEGHGTLLVQKNAKDYYDRATKECEACRETGLKGVPESEVNSIRWKS